MSFPLAKLPPLDLVRGFVAVARRLSITAAAHDLHVTQSAVSRQIRTLEAHLGVALLKRGFRSVSLTPEGAQLFRLADPWLTQLSELTHQWRMPGHRLPITVTTTIGVAALWLLPRLGAFQQAYPTIDVRVAADNRLMDLERESVDIAIRYCTANEVNDKALWLFDETIQPIAHASCRLTHLNAATLAQQVLLDFDDPSRPWLQWSHWLHGRGLAHIRPQSTLRFNQYDQVVHAALAGHGLALGRNALIADMLADGRLAVVGEDPPDLTPLAYWLVRNPQRQSNDADIVSQWLHTQARAQPSVHLGTT